MLISLWAVRDPGRPAGRCGHETRVLTGAKALSLGCPAAQARKIQGDVAVVRHGATAPLIQSGAALLELSRPECGTVVGSPAGCEVCRGALRDQSSALDDRATFANLTLEDDA